jgi:hypothetical protein
LIVDAGVRSISKVDGQARRVRLHQYPLDQQQAVARLQSFPGSVQSIDNADVSPEREFDTSILGFMGSHSASIGTSRFTLSFTIFLVSPEEW